MARTVLDAALLHEAIGGHDPLDSTSIDAPLPVLAECARRGADGDLSGVTRRRRPRARRRGARRRLRGRRPRPASRAAVALLESLGAEVREVSCPAFDLALAAYYLIAPSEASSNLARFDGVRYGLRVGDDGSRDLDEVMALTREQGFGPEVKRRIILGTYALSSGYYEAYYGQAQKVRTLISRDFSAAWRYDRASTCWSAPPRRPSRSRSAPASTTRSPCTPPTCARCPRAWPACRPSRCPAGCPRGCRSGSRSWRRRWPTTAATGWPPRWRRP